MRSTKRFHKSKKTKALRKSVNKKHRSNNIVSVKNSGYEVSARSHHHSGRQKSKRHLIITKPPKKLRERRLVTFDSVTTKAIAYPQPYPKSSKNNLTLSPQANRWGWLALAFGLILTGFNLMASAGLYHLYQKTILSFRVAPVVTAEAKLRGAIPTKIQVADVKIDLPILPVTIVDGIWETSDNKATYLNLSARPLEGGNIIIYGHNRPSVFSSLHRVEVGDEIKLTTQDDKLHRYVVREIKVVKADGVEEVLPTDHEVLTIYTCTGWLDTKRLVLKAVPFKDASLAAK